ncbi:MAG TPA: hypothetical protein VI757_04105 [Bacteroidia bacterium]|nr:hypothetical protein [Bacteroidia bacterium]
MISKGILAEKILRKINGGDYPTSNKVDIRDVYLEMEACRNYLIQKYLIQSGDEISSEFISVFEEVPVLKNTNRDRLYAQLPAQLVSLNIKGASGSHIGLRQVSGVKDEYNVFLPMNSGDAGVHYGLESSNLIGGIGYWLENDKIIFENMPAYYEGKNVMVKMISAIQGLGEDDFVPVPAAVETELEDMIFERMIGMKAVPEKKITDNNPNTP